MNKIVVKQNTITALTLYGDMGITLHAGDQDDDMRQRVISVFLSTVFADKNPYYCRIISANVHTGHITVLCDMPDGSLSKALDPFRDAILSLYNLEAAEASATKEP